jgi:hypothetical protein
VVEMSNDEDDIRTHTIRVVITLVYIGAQKISVAKFGFMISKVQQK